MHHQAALPSPAAGPLACWQSCTRTFSGRADHLGRVRAMLTHFLDGFPAATDVTLLVSEFCANAIAHSASGQPGGAFTVRIRLRGTYLRAEVEDQGSYWDGSLAAAQPPHGLFLLRALSHTCGTLTGADGWVTWFTIQASATGEAG